MIVKHHVKPDDDYANENNCELDTENIGGVAETTRRQDKQQYRRYESVHIEDMRTQDEDVIGSGVRSSCETSPATLDTDHQQTPLSPSTGNADQDTAVSRSKEHVETTPADGAESEHQENGLCRGANAAATETMSSDMIVAENDLYEQFGGGIS